MDRVENGKSPVEVVIRLQTEDFKTLFVARTLGDGKPLHLDNYVEAFDQSFFQDFEAVAERLLSGGLIDADESQIVLTETGKLVYDLVTLAFYPIRAKEWLLERLKAFQLGDAATQIVPLRRM